MDKTEKDTLSTPIEYTQTKVIGVNHNTMRTNRLMALFTLLLTVGYSFIIGILKLEPTFRIFSFLVLGVVLLIVSLVYTKLRVKSTTSETTS